MEHTVSCGSDSRIAWSVVFQRNDRQKVRRINPKGTEILLHAQIVYDSQL